MNKLFKLTLVLLIFGSACESKKETNEPIEKTESMYPKDHHSFALPDEAVINHLDLDIAVDFEEKLIAGKASYAIANNEADKIFFDTRNLNIEKVTLGDDEEETNFNLLEEKPVLGQALEVVIKPNTEKVNIYYSTSQDAAALQWLNPQQTAGKVHPFLFTQGQAILTRTWVPLQDSPGIRFTYKAKVKVPSELLAVMSASNPQAKNETGVYEFEMKQPIPGYLMALSVGDLEFQAIDKRTGVYAEPSTLDAAVYEFADMEKMLLAAEELYGAYDWDRYDVLVLPPSFPFGGMENPRLTFATPTILAGDRSLTALIAHELAHSWSGNLVTNATWDDFWMNEGFTVYFEKRIMEALYGESYVNMLSVLGYQDLLAEVEDLNENGKAKDTHLKLALKDRDPDEGMTNIAYEKGCLMLETLEAQVGREKFDAFLQQYFSKHAFTTITTEAFVEYLNAELLAPNKLEFNTSEWIYEAGIPENAVKPESDRFEKVETAMHAFLANYKPSELETDEWTTHEWLHFVRNLPDNLSSEDMAKLDNGFDFTNTGNAEIAAVWFEKSITNNYSAAFPKMENFLINVGRRKFLTPLYRALAKTEEGKALGLKIYTKARPNYHSVSTNTIDEILGRE